MALTVGTAISLKGPMGAPGVSFLVGTGAPTGTAVPNQGYLDAQAGDLYQYVSGSWSLVRSIIGPMGLNGINGSFFAGVGVPDNTTYSGTGNALYVRANGEVYLYQGSGNWSDTGENLSGPTGAKGADGLRGTQIYHGNGAFNAANYPNAQAGDLYFQDDAGTYAFITTA